MKPLFQTTLTARSHDTWCNRLKCMVVICNSPLNHGRGIRRHMRRRTAQWTAHWVAVFVNVSGRPQLQLDTQSDWFMQHHLFILVYSPFICIKLLRQNSNHLHLNKHFDSAKTKKKCLLPATHYAICTYTIHFIRNVCTQEITPTANHLAAEQCSGQRALINIHNNHKIKMWSSWLLPWHSHHMADMNNPETSNLLGFSYTTILRVYKEWCK